MLVLVSFVLVLAAAVTLVVGLLQSGLTLIYLSIGCSVLAGVVLAVAVLRGRPGPRTVSVERVFTPPPQVPASVGAPGSGAQTGSWTAPSYPSAPPPPAPAPPSSPPPAGDDSATKAAGTALLGRLRGRKGQDDPAGTDAGPAVGPEPTSVAGGETTELPVVPAGPDGGFPIADFDQLRATDLLRLLGPLDRNQLEAVRQRESSGKNRFTIMSRIDVLLAAQAEPAWEVADDEWDADAEAGTTLIEAGAAGDEDDDDFAAGEVEADEVDDLVSPADDFPADDFPIAGYDTLTVGQILPRLSDLDAGELAQVRAREQQGKGRGTILDRVDRLSSRSAPPAMAMPAAPPARKAPAARRARVAKEAPETAPTPAAPMKEAVKRARAVKAAPAEAPAPPRRGRPRKDASPVAPVAPVRKAAARKAAKAAPAATPMKEAVRKAAARKAATKRP